MGASSTFKVPALLLPGWSWKVSPSLLVLCVSREFLAEEAVVVVAVGVCTDSEVYRHHGMGVLVP